jgi:hypothetical protein
MGFKPAFKGLIQGTEQIKADGFPSNKIHPL